eukprot:scaffold9343_cov110-Isochrysis_galbana.AAC.3
MSVFWKAPAPIDVSRLGDSSLSSKTTECSRGHAAKAYAPILVTHRGTETSFRNWQPLKLSAGSSRRVGGHRIWPAPSGAIRHPLTARHSGSAASQRSVTKCAPLWRSR